MIWVPFTELIDRRQASAVIWLTIARARQPAYAGPAYHICQSDTIAAALSGVRHGFAVAKAHPFTLRPLDGGGSILFGTSCGCRGCGLEVGWRPLAHPTAHARRSPDGCCREIARDGAEPSGAGVLSAVGAAAGAPAAGRDRARRRGAPAVVLCSRCGLAAAVFLQPAPDPLAWAATRLDGGHGA